MVALLGPRQVGKTTLARAFAQTMAAPSASTTSSAVHKPSPSPVTFFDLEDPMHEARLQNPKLALQDLKGLIVIDEIQRRPDLFPVLRVLVDRPDNSAKFLVLGSASRELIRQGSESLAGRIRYLELAPFSIRELAPSADTHQLWLRGGFPPAFLAAEPRASEIWRDAYIRTYLEQDIPALGINIPAATLRRFWVMLAHYHGQLFNASEIGKSIGVSDTTVRRYLDILSSTFMVRQLHPWHANLKKRQIKSPKIYIRDSGIFHRLLSLNGDQQILEHPKLGASWEGFALEQTLQALQLEEGQFYFWGVHGQLELDLLALRDGGMEGFEIKYTDRPTLTPSMRQAVELLGLKKLYVVYPGRERFLLLDQVEAISLADTLALGPRLT